MPADSMGSGVPSLLNHKIGAEEILDVYRIALGREPESEAVIAAHLERRETIADFIQIMLGSEEFLARCRVLSSHRETLEGAGLVRRIDVRGEAVQIEQLMAHSSRVWSEYGANDPYWSVLTAEGFRRELFDGGTEDVFYKTGASDAAVLEAVVTRNGLKLPLDGTVLDLGCGVGRVGEHLSDMFSSYVGVDISEPHLTLAKQRLEKMGRTNAQFRTLIDFLDGAEKFDCVYSILVLQHNPPPIMLFLIERILAALRPGGIALFQVPCAFSDYEFNLVDYLDDLSNRHEMEMHAIPQHAVFEAVRANGCQLIEGVDDGRIVPFARSFTFLVQRP